MSDQRYFQIEVHGDCPQEILAEIAGSLSYYNTADVPEKENGTYTFCDEDMNYGAYGWLDNYGGYAITNELIANNIAFDLTTGPGDYDGYDISWRPGMKAWLEQTKTTTGDVVMTSAEYRQVLEQTDEPEKIAEIIRVWFEGPGPIISKTEGKEDT